MKLPLIAILGLVAGATTAPAGNSYVVHERRQETNKWSASGDRLRRDTVIPMSIGLTQRNLDYGYDFLMDMSHPSSPNYGKHWSLEKVWPEPRSHASHVPLFVLTYS